MKNILGAKIVWVLLGALMFSLILVSVGFAAIEVKEDDWAKYRIEAGVPGEIANMTGFEEFEELEWIKVEVQSVSGTSVTLEMTMHFKNGTEEKETIPGTGLIIDTDLGEGDPVTTPIFEEGLPMNITGSKQRTYAGASREVNYVDYDLEEMGMSMNFEAYWDKATGILCELVMSISGELLGQTVEISTSVKMTETNLWESAAFWTEWWFLAIIAIIVILVVGSAIVLMRRRKAPLPEVAPTPTE